MNSRLSKRYLISLSALYLAGALVIAVFLFAAAHSESLSADFTLPQCIGIGCLCALVPTGAFAGAVYFGLKLKTLSKNQMILIVVLLPLLLAFIIVSGIILIIQTAVNAVRVIRTGD